MTTKPFKSIADLSTDFLPIDEDWQGWNSDSPVFGEFVKATSPKTIIEVGTWKGRSCRRWAELAPEASIYCVDTWLGGIDHYLSNKPQDDLKPDMHGSPRIYEQFLRNFKGHPAASRIYPIRQTSTNGARALWAKGIFADLIYIDGSHEFQDAYDDIVNYSRLLAPNGRIFGDDYGFPGVQVAVHRYALETGRRVGVKESNFWTFM